MGIFEEPRDGSGKDFTAGGGSTPPTVEVNSRGDARAPDEDPSPLSPDHLGLGIFEEPRDGSGKDFTAGGGWTPPTVEFNSLGNARAPDEDPSPLSPDHLDLGIIEEPRDDVGNGSGGIIPGKDFAAGRGPTPPQIEFDSMKGIRAPDGAPSLLLSPDPIGRDDFEANKDPLGIGPSVPPLGTSGTGPPRDEDVNPLPRARLGGSSAEFDDPTIALGLTTCTAPLEINSVGGLEAAQLGVGVPLVEKISSGGLDDPAIALGVKTCTASFETVTPPLETMSFGGFCVMKGGVLTSPGLKPSVTAWLRETPGSTITTSRRILLPERFGGKTTHGLWRYPEGVEARGAEHDPLSDPDEPPELSDNLPISLRTALLDNDSEGAAGLHMDALADTLASLATDSSDPPAPAVDLAPRQEEALEDSSSGTSLPSYEEPTSLDTDPGGYGTGPLATLFKEVGGAAAVWGFDHSPGVYSGSRSHPQGMPWVPQRQPYPWEVIMWQQPEAWPWPFPCHNMALGSSMSAPFCAPTFPCQGMGWDASSQQPQWGPLASSGGTALLDNNSEGVAGLHMDALADTLVSSPLLKKPRGRQRGKNKSTPSSREALDPTDDPANGTDVTHQAWSDITSDATLEQLSGREEPCIASGCDDPSPEFPYSALAPLPFEGGATSEATSSSLQTGMSSTGTHPSSNDVIVSGKKKTTRRGGARFGVNKIAQRYCEHVGIPATTVWDRHENQECYFCGEPTRDGDNRLMHYFWDCPDWLKVERRVIMECKDVDTSVPDPDGPLASSGGNFGQPFDPSFPNGRGRFPAESLDREQHIFWNGFTHNSASYASPVGNTYNPTGVAKEGFVSPGATSSPGNDSELLPDSDKPYISEGFCRVRCPVTPSDGPSDLSDAETECLSEIGGILRDCELNASGTCGRNQTSGVGGGHSSGFVVRVGALQHSVPPVAPGRVTRSRSSLAPPSIGSGAATGRVPSRDSAPPAMAAVLLLPPSTPASTRLPLGLPPGALPQLDYPGTPEFEGLWAASPPTLSTGSGPTAAPLASPPPVLRAAGTASDPTLRVARAVPGQDSGTGRWNASGQLVAGGGPPPPGDDPPDDDPPDDDSSGDPSGDPPDGHGHPLPTPCPECGVDVPWNITWAEHTYTCQGPHLGAAPPALSPESAGVAIALDQPSARTYVSTSESSDDEALVTGSWYDQDPMTLTPARFQERVRASTSALKSERSADSDGSGRADLAQRPGPPPEARYPDNLGAGTPRAAVRGDLLGRESDILAGTPVAVSAHPSPAPALGLVLQPARTGILGAAVALSVQPVDSAADDTESSAHEGGGAMADPSPLPARSPDSSVTLGSTSPSSSAAGSRALPASTRSAGTASRDRALLHALAVRMDTFDAQALGRAEVAQRDTTRMFDEMMRVLQDNGAQSADDRRRFADEQQVRWTELHRDLKPLIASKVTSLTRQMMTEVATHRSAMEATLDRLCVRADEGERKAAVHQKRFADTLNLLQISRDLDAHRATTQVLRPAVPQPVETPGQTTDAAFLFEYDLPSMPLIDTEPPGTGRTQVALQSRVPPGAHLWAPRLRPLPRLTQAASGFRHLSPGEGVDPRSVGRAWIANQPQRVRLVALGPEAWASHHGTRGNGPRCQMSTGSESDCRTRNRIASMMRPWIRT